MIDISAKVYLGHSEVRELFPLSYCAIQLSSRYTVLTDTMRRRVVADSDCIVSLYMGKKILSCQMENSHSLARPQNSSSAYIASILKAIRTEVGFGSGTETRPCKICAIRRFSGSTAQASFNQWLS